MSVLQTHIEELSAQLREHTSDHASLLEYAENALRVQENIQVAGGWGKFYIYATLCKHDAIHGTDLSTSVVGGSDTSILTKPTAEKYDMIIRHFDKLNLYPYENPKYQNLSVSHYEALCVRPIVKRGDSQFIFEQLLNQAVDNPEGRVSLTVFRDRIKERFSEPSNSAPKISQSSSTSAPAYPAFQAFAKSVNNPLTLDDASQFVVNAIVQDEAGALSAAFKILETVASTYEPTSVADDFESTRHGAELDRLSSLHALLESLTVRCEEMMVNFVNR